MDHQTFNRLEAAETERQDGALGAPGARPESEAGPVRARLNGLPCLVSVSATATISGRMAVPPFAGERRPLPTKGRRATLDLIEPSEGAAAGEEPEDAPLASIEIMVVEASRRSGRFSGRVLGLTDDEARALAALAHG